jgi:putative resolvase
MIIKIGAAAKILGVSIETMRKWEKSGEVLPLRKSQSGTRYYDLDAVNMVAEGRVVPPACPQTAGIADEFEDCQIPD